MEILFLGTSSGTPTRTRNVSGLSIKTEHSKTWYLVDCGEGTQHQILQSSLSLNNLSAIYITHVHGDHCYGLPGLLASAAMQGRTNALSIVGPKSVLEFLEGVQTSSGLYLPYTLNFSNVDEIKTFETADFKINAVSLSHRVPTYAYEFTELQIKKSLNVDKLIADGIPPGIIWGQLQKGLNVVTDNGNLLRSDYYLLESRKPRKIVICGDNDNPELLNQSCREANLLVHEATYTKEIEVRVGAGRQHCSAEAIARFAESISLKNLILTHFSPRFHDNRTKTPNIDDIENEARSFYKGVLCLANDFDKFRLDRDGMLSKITSHR